MGKVTIIVQTSELPTSELERACHRSMTELSLGVASVTENGADPDIFIVPADEEFPDLG